MQAARKKIAIGAKVLIGFSVAILAVAIAGVINYSSMNRLVAAVKTISEPDEKLISLRSLLDDLDDEENFARTYSLTQDTQNITAFNAVLDSLHHRVADLKVLTMNNDLQVMIADTISELVAAREGLLGSFIEKRKVGLPDQLKTTPIQFHKVSEEVDLPDQDIPIAQIVLPISQASPAVSDSLEKEEVPSEKKKTYSLLEWVKGLFGTSDNSEENKSDEQNAEKPVPVNNNNIAEAQIPQQNQVTLLEPKKTLPDNSIDIKAILSQQQSELKEQVQVWSMDQLLLLQQDKELMDKIRSAIARLEENEMAILKRQGDAANTVANRANQAVGIVGLLGILSTLIFGYLIFADITRSNRLRSQLIEESLRSEKLAKTKEQFLANMSHEIRTPLNAITGFVEQLSKEKVNEKQHRFINAIERSADHLASLVNEILDYSKLESGMLHRQATTFDFYALVREVYSTFKMRATEKNIWISYNIESSVPQFVTGDVLSMKQILINLISNGVKFTNQGSVDIQCSAASHDERFVTIKSVVKDTGIGIPLEMQENVFKEFLQADNEITRKYGGTGLGLAITRKLVEALRGNIEVISTQGIGSSFTVTIPFQKALAPEQEPSLSLTSAETAFLKNKSVLIVDDEEMNLFLAQTILESWQVTTAVARNGKEAIELFNEKMYDLILLDIQMPEMSGIDVAKTIRAFPDECKSRTPLIALTANVFTEHLREQAETGFNDVLIKPFKERDLFEKIKQVWFSLSVKGDSGQGLLSSSPMEDNGTLFSLRYLENTSGSNQEFLIRMIQSFISNNGRHLHELDQGMMDQNWKVINQIAHKMIPSFRYLMIGSGESKLKMLEHYTDMEINLKEVPRLVNEISEITNQVIKEMEEKIRSLRSINGQITTLEWLSDTPLN